MWSPGMLLPPIVPAKREAATLAQAPPSESFYERSQEVRELKRNALADRVVPLERLHQSPSSMRLMKSLTLSSGAVINSLTLPWCAITRSRAMSI